MSFRDDLKAGCADAALQICRELGAQITFSHKGATGVSLYCAPDDRAIALRNVLDTDAESTEVAFDVPTQTNFPPTHGVAVNDEITFDGKKYYVRFATADSVGAIYRLECERVRARVVA